MSHFLGRDREVRIAYGFDEIALVPGNSTLDPDDTDMSIKLGGHTLELPFLASAMDGVVDTQFAADMGKLGGLAVLNLDGINTRYDNVRELTRQISQSEPDTATQLIQELYSKPILPELIAKRVKEIKASGVLCAVSCVPANAAKFGPIARDAGADFFFVQSTVIAVNHRSSKGNALDLKKFCAEMKIPVIAGNAVRFRTALELMETGIAGLLVGVGPGAACTSRGVLGIGVPQVTATVDCAAARDFYYKKSGRYVPIFTDGGMTSSGDICKAMACGADGIMVGSMFAKSHEAPGFGCHWGMATPHADLPRGTRVRVQTIGSLKEILRGPSRYDDGSMNLAGALRTCMGTLGASTIREMQQAKIVIAPSIKSEGKVYQRTQHIGMCK